MKGHKLNSNTSIDCISFILFLFVYNCYFRCKKDNSMIYTRRLYILLFILTIFIGLMSRKLTFIPVITGDILYAMMSYWMMRILFINKQKYYSLIYALLFCYCIETLQLVDLPFLVYLRNHNFYRLIFGQGFLWEDIIAYTFGVTIVFLLDYKYFKKD